MTRFLREEVEEIPLRHQRHESALDRQVAHVCDGDPPVRDAGGEGADFVVRPFQELVEQPQLAQKLEGRGVDRVTAEIPEEIGVLLEHEHPAAGAREQQAGHHPCGAAARNHEVQI